MNLAPTTKRPREVEGSRRLCLTAADLDALNSHRTGPEGQAVCHAPVRSLYFGLRGEVYTCCFNKTHAAGSYPAQSIREIWEGSAIRTQRAAIEERDLSIGCAGCYSIIKGRNISALPLRAYDALAPDNHGMPARMEFELFNTCNLECIMCRGEFSSAIRANREKRPPIPAPYDSAFFEQLEEFIPTLKSCRFLGGEPFLIPAYVALWERMAFLNPSLAIFIQTNATVLNQRTMDILRGGKFHISVSLDSVHQEGYEAIRKNARFDRVMENVGWLGEYTRGSGTTFGISCCPMTQNWRELPDVVLFANESGASLHFTTVEAPTECSLQALPAAEIMRIRESLSAFVPPANNAVEAGNRQAFLGLLAQIEAWETAARWKAANGIAGPPADLAAFLAQIERVARSTASVEATGKMMTEIEGTLRFILEYAELRGLREPAEAKMISSPPELLCRSMPGLSRQDALRLFQAFVFPID